MVLVVLTVLSDYGHRGVGLFFLPKTGTQLSVGKIGALTSGTARGGGHPHSGQPWLLLCIKSTQGVRAKPIQILIENVQVNVAQLWYHSTGTEGCR